MEVAALVKGMIKVVNRQEEAMGQEEALDQEEPDHQEEAIRRSKQEEGAGHPGSTPPTPPGIQRPPRPSDPWGPLERSRKDLPKLMLPSNYKACNILEMRQLLETWYDIR